jgi:hypothetical protein
MSCCAIPSARNDATNLRDDDKKPVKSSGVIEFPANLSKMVGYSFDVRRCILGITPALNGYNRLSPSPGGTRGKRQL